MSDYPPVVIVYAPAFSPHSITISFFNMGSASSNAARPSPAANPSYAGGPSQVDDSSYGDNSSYVDDSSTVVDASSAGDSIWNPEKRYLTPETEPPPSRPTTGWGDISPRSLEISDRCHDISTNAKDHTRIRRAERIENRLKEDKEEEATKPASRRPE